MSRPEGAKQSVSHHRAVARSRAARSLGGALTDAASGVRSTRKMCARRCAGVAMPRVPRVVSVWMSRRARDEQPVRCARGVSSERLTVACVPVVEERRRGQRGDMQQPQACAGGSKSPALGRVRFLRSKGASQDLPVLSKFESRVCRRIAKVPRNIRRPSSVFRGQKYQHTRARPPNAARTRFALA